MGRPRRLGMEYGQRVAALLLKPSFKQEGERERGSAKLGLLLRSVVESVTCFGLGGRGASSAQHHQADGPASLPGHLRMGTVSMGRAGKGER